MRSSDVHVRRGEEEKSARRIGEREEPGLLTGPREAQATRREREETRRKEHGSEAERKDNVREVPRKLMLILEQSQAR